ncbi:MAG: EAL and HDOD domain-containing protein, partial [Pseudomonadota bacterium]
MELLVARQPIFDRQLKVFAYELLFRSGVSNVCDCADGDAATSKVITAILYSPDGADIQGGKQVFINFAETLLLNGGASVLPPGTAVIEVLETVTPGKQVIAACRKLRARGYKIALDDFVDTEKFHPLAPLADFIKVDLRATSEAEQRAIVARYGRSLKLVAEKVETKEEFQRAAAMGFTYFQGYFFARPVITSTRDIAGFKLNYL